MNADDTNGKPIRKPLQFGLGSLFLLITLLCSAAAFVAWIRPYYEMVGIDPQLIVLSLMAMIVMGAASFALGRWVQDLAGKLAARKRP